MLLSPATVSLLLKREENRSGSAVCHSVEIHIMRKETTQDIFLNKVCCKYIYIKILSAAELKYVIGAKGCSYFFEVLDG